MADIVTKARNDTLYDDGGAIIATSTYGDFAELDSKNPQPNPDILNTRFGDRIANNPSSSVADGSGIGALVDDETPQLGGDLDMNGYEINGVTEDEISYLIGVTSGIQAQLNAKGNGDVVGPASSTDHAIARFNLATGKLLQNSTVLIDDAGTVTIPSGQSVSSGTNDTLKLISPIKTGTAAFGLVRRTGGNARGNNAVDLQSDTGNSNTEVASGSNSVICGGIGNTASNEGSMVCGGVNNVAAGPFTVVCGGNTNSVANEYYSMIIGGDSNTCGGTGGSFNLMYGSIGIILCSFGTILNGESNAIAAYGDYGFIMGGHNNLIDGVFYANILSGCYGVARRTGELIHTTERFETSGDAQHCSLNVSGKTSGPNTYVLRICDADDAPPTGVNQRIFINTFNNSTILFKATIVGRSDNDVYSDTTTSCGYIVTGVAERVDGTLSILSQSTTVIHEDDAGLDAVAVANNTDGSSLDITVTGIADVYMKWFAHVELDEINLANS